MKRASNIFSLALALLFASAAFAQTSVPEIPYDSAPNFLKLPDNSGFSRGMNAGIEVARGLLVAGLNSDTLVGRNVSVSLQRSLTALNQRIGFLAVPVFDADRM